MKRFLKRIIGFSVVIIIGLSLLSIGLNSYFRKCTNFILENQPKYLVAGHSHAECAFNDEVIPSLKNVAEAAESYYYTYFKLREILPQNPSVNAVFIEFTNNMLEVEMDRRIWENQYMDRAFPNYVPFIEFSEQKLLLRNNTGGYLKSLLKSQKLLSWRLLKRDFDYTKQAVGGFHGLEENDVQDIVQRIFEQYPNYHQEQVALADYELAFYNLNYLDKILALCDSLEKQVILIRSPQHTMYPGINNEDIFQEIRSVRYADRVFLDFGKLPLTDDYFADLEHLNRDGATYFSIWFSELLKDDLIVKRNKEEFVKVRIEMDF